MDLGLTGPTADTFVAGVGGEVWVSTGRNAPGVLWHEDRSGWHRADAPGGPFASIWGAAPDDVWFAGTTLVHWDGATFTALPTLPAKGSLVTLVSGSAHDDVWAVEPEVALIHFDGTTWSAVATPTKEPVRVVHAVARNDVWAAATGIEPGLYHYDGTTWSQVLNSFYASSMWSTAADDVWFGMSRHWDGETISVVSSLVGDPVAMWGDAGHVWAVDYRGVYHR